MRWAPAIAAALALWMTNVGPVKAGLYNTAEPIVVPSRDFRKFQDTLISLRQGALPIEIPDKDGKKKVIRTPLYRRNELIATLSARGSLASLTVEQRLDVSAYLIRLQKFREGINLLVPAQQQERDNFLVLSNLATGEQLDGQLVRAADYLYGALELWPKAWSRLAESRRKWLEGIGWNEQDFLWFREVETYQLKLLRLRAREMLGLAKLRPDDVDGLFDQGGKLQFVGPGGTYEAGKLAPEQQAKLPKKAIEIVEQLLLWLPYDNRLEWLLGELYNAAGDVPTALAIFKDVASRWNASGGNHAAFTSDAALPPLFKKHLAILQQHTSADLKIAEAPAVSFGSPEPPDKQAEGGAAVDWKSLGVGFGGGIAIAFLASWQFREIRRRRRSGSIA
jgi:hypothetical protein